MRPRGQESRAAGTDNYVIETKDVVIDAVRSTSDNFSVFSGRFPGEMFPATIKTFSGPAFMGQRWTIAGQWKEDPKWGKQFVASFAAPSTPTTMAELMSFLPSVPGWSHQQAYRIFASILPDDAIALVESDPQRFLALGATEAMIEDLQAAWQRGRGLAQVFAQLGEWGISSKLSERLVKAYRTDTPAILEADPFRPIHEVSHYSFKVADALARVLGLGADDPRRVTAGLAETVRRECIEDGHTWVRGVKALFQTVELLGIDEDPIVEVLENADEGSTIVREGDRLYPGLLHRAEQYIADQLVYRAGLRSTLGIADDMLLDASYGLSDEQQSAVRMALLHPIATLTGGPGVGKTRTIGQIVKEARRMQVAITLMAPTGKAARRMEEATGHAAATIHKTLGLLPGDIEVPEGTVPLTGIVVVDECSMLDTTLAAAMLSGISPRAHVLLVGDPDQLPSVGPGAVLRDILASEILSRTHLTRVFRNDAGIAVNAALIRAGQPIRDLPDCQIMPADTPEDARRLVLDLVSRLQVGGYSFDDILVLTPKNDGESGRHTLNGDLQRLLNANEQGCGIELRSDANSYELRRNDRVIITKNSTELGVSNGEVGTISAVHAPRSIIVQLDDRQVELKGEDRYICQLGYALTVHKAQGSEAPIVIIPVFHSRVLDRAWLYTALTRARSHVYLIGDVAAIQSCIRIARMHERRTGLQARIHQRTQIHPSSLPALAAV